MIDRIQQFHKNKMKHVGVFGKWSYLLIFVFPVAGYFGMLKYYTPQPFHISIELSCQSNQCQPKLDDQAIQKIYSDIQNQIDQTNRLDQFSRPFGVLINLQPRVTNKSTITIHVSEPVQDSYQQVAVACQLFPNITEIFTYNSGIFFANRTRLVDTPNTVKMIVNTLISCFRGFETNPTSKLNLIVAPKGTVSIMDPKIDFLVELFPDGMSHIFVVFEVIAIFCTLLPLLKEGVKFAIKGWSYFIK
jgi:hypothetical protein